MTGNSVAAVLLAAALLTAPPRRRRFRGAKSTHRSGQTVGAAVIAAALGATVFLISPAAAAAGVLAATVVSLRLRRRRSRRCRRTQGEAMAAALRTVVGELRIGAHPVRAFDTAATEAAEAADAAGTVVTALRALAARVRLGSDVAAGIADLGPASALPVHWSRIEVCWRLAIDHGLPISLLMSAAHRDIVERQRFSDRVDAALAGPRATAVILAGLPVLPVVLGHLIGAQPLRFLLGGGGWFLVAGVTLICAGLGWADHIIDRLAP
jgi:tight adherence protein B